MRKRRVIIFRDELLATSALKRFFEGRGYETMVFREPTICPVYGDVEKCPGPYSCGDIVLLNFSMPAMNGMDLLSAQQQRGCKLTPLNKAIIAGSIPDDQRATLTASGSAFFQNPINFSKLEKWVTGCETRMDLGQPVVIRRREERETSRPEVLSIFLADRNAGYVTVVNKSNCGICFKTSHRLLPNQVITLQARSSVSPEEALVRWIRAAGDGTFFVGISFCI